MFGYVRPAADRLTQEQTDLFRSAYCGLCRTLGRRYGLPARMILNYDLAFLAILLAGGSGFSCARHRCPVHPIRGCPCGEENPALDAAADLSVILTWWQLRDGVTDHGFFGGLKYRLAALLLRRSYRKAARLRPDFDRLVQGCLGELAELERENCPSIDRPADTFARLLAGAAEEEPDPVRRRGLAQLLYLSLIHISEPTAVPSGPLDIPDGRSGRSGQGPAQRQLQSAAPAIFGAGGQADGGEPSGVGPDHGSVRGADGGGLRTVGVRRMAADH